MKINETLRGVIPLSSKWSLVGLCPSFFLFFFFFDGVLSNYVNKWWKSEDN